MTGPGQQQMPPQGGWGAQPGMQPGMQPGGAPAPGGAQPGGQPTDDERLWAAIAHAAMVIGFAVVGPLVVYMMKKDSSEYVANHALQSIYFGIAGFVLSILTCGLGSIVWLVFEVIAALKAYQGEWYDLPVVAKYANQKHPAPGGPPATF